MRSLSSAIPGDCRLLRSDGLQRWFVHEPPCAVDEVRVIKQLAPSVSVDQGVVARWLQIAALNADLQHPGCTRVEDWGVREGAAYVVGRRASGVALRVLLEAVRSSGARLAGELVAPIGVMILEALDYAQQREPALVHLDLDLEGITLRSDGTVVLPEFALWSVLSPADVARCRFESGRVQYCSPELVQSRRGDCRSDVFSVGAVLYQLLTGEPPFLGPTHLVVAMAIADGKRHAVRTRAPEAPEGLCDVLESMLATHACERFQTPAAAANALRSTIRVEDGASAIGPPGIPPALFAARAGEATRVGRPAVPAQHALVVHDGRTAFLRERPRREHERSREPVVEPPLVAPRVLPSSANGARFVLPELVVPALCEPRSAADPLAATWLGAGKAGRWLDPSETVFQAKERPVARTASAPEQASLLVAWSRQLVFVLAALVMAVAVCWALCLL